MDTDVAIVGGGIAGLAAAYELHRRGLAFVLLEAQPCWGGVVRTVRTDGFLLEGGPDAFIAQKPEALALCRELGLEGSLVGSNTENRTVFLLRKGRLVPMPEGLALGVPTRLAPMARSPLISWPGKARMALDLVLPRRRGSGDESVAEFFRRRLGREALARLADPLLGAIHGGDPERMSLRAVLPRMAELEDRHRSLLLGLRRARSPRPTSAAPAFYSLRGGLIELVNALVARLPRESLRAGTAVRSARVAVGSAVVETAAGDVRARAIVLAVPPKVAAELLGPLDSEAERLLSSVPVSSSVTVHLAYRREDVAHPLDGHGLLVPRDEGLRCVACGFASTKFPGRAPTGHVLLRGAVGGMRDPQAAQLDERALVDLVHTEMSGPLGLRARPVLARAFRWPDATPQMEVGHLERVARLEEQLTRIPGIFVTGGGLRGVGLPDVIGDARRTAAQAAASIARS
ncbi:MAG TPA: protoporphyrinogen oxidase [Vicinamibacteria bacterium]|nr:protoporphyrinogen oxidase [Vicinamibacteria bacterium]